MFGKVIYLNPATGLLIVSYILNNRKSENWKMKNINPHGQGKGGPFMTMTYGPFNPTYTSWIYSGFCRT